MEDYVNIYLACNLPVIDRKHSYILCLKKTCKLWNSTGQNYKDRFWWYLAEIFKRL